jgi:hypothetical protein
MRALYGIKRSVNKSKLSFRSLTTLFDSLIKPIVLYGAPIYTPTMSIIKNITKELDHTTNSKSHLSTLRKISLLNCEKVHLHFLKWAMGVHRKASNVGVWGDSGRYPLIYECMNLTLKYATRLKNLNDNSLVSLAFKEQMNLKLDWYRGLEPALALDPCYTADHVTAFRRSQKITSQVNESKNDNNTFISKPPKEDFLIHNGFKKRIPPQSTKPINSKVFTSHVILKALKYRFRNDWSIAINESKKLSFYRELKTKFTKESYLDYVKYADRSNTTRIRISAHRLQIELGRYNKTPKEDRICAWCNTVLGIRVIEDENHFLTQCDLNAQTRQRLIEKINSITSNSMSPSTSYHVIDTTNFVKLISMENEIFTSITSEGQAHVSRILARFLTNCLRNRENFSDSMKKLKYSNRS